MDSPASKYRYDAFISYSRRDADFSKALEAALENYRTPKDLPIRQRNLDIFRDEADFTGTAYHESVQRHLEQSATLIVICSPDAAQSEYVEDEIRRFAGDDPSRRLKIIPLLYRGLPNNEAGPDQKMEEAFPAALCEFLEMPLGIDYRGFNPKKHKPNRGIYENSWYTVLANICGVSRAEIEERDRRRRNRIRRLQAGAVSAVIISLSIALIITLISRQQAVREQHLAESGRLSANALNVLSVDPQLSLLLGLESAMLSYSSNGTVSVEAQDALHRAVPMAREQLRLSGHSGFVSALAFSPDRRVLATADLNEVRLWDTVNGSQLPLRLDEAGSALGLAFSPDGSKLATAGKDHIARLWDVTSGRELRTFDGHAGSLWSVAFSPDGTRLATASRDATAKVWGLASGEELKTLTGHTGDVNTIAFSPDGKLLATGGADGATRIWDAVSGRQLHELSGEGSIRGVAFSPDGKRLATVNFRETTVRIWDVVSGRQLSNFGDHTGSVFAVAYSPDGSQLVTASLDKTARLWDAASGKALFTFTGHTDSVASVAFSSDGEHIATGSEDGTARIWEIEEPSELPPLLGHTSTIKHVAFSPDGTRIATASEDNTARIWEATTGRELLALTQGGAVESVAFSPDGRRLATANSNGTGTVFDAASGAELLALMGHRAEVMSIVYSRDGQRMATGSLDKTAKIWDALSGKELATIHSDVGQVEAVDLNANATRVAIALYDDKGDSGATAQVWDVQSGRVLTNLDGDHVWVNQVVFNRDGTRIVTTGSTPPFLAKVWDTASGRELLALSGNTAPVLTAAYSPDGNTLATGGEDSAIKLWDPLNGGERFTLFAPHVTVENVAFSPGGERLASADSDRTVRLYAMNPKDLIVIAATRLTRTLTADECRHYLQRDDCSEAPSSRLVEGKELVKTGKIDAALATFRRVFSADKVADPESAAKLLLGELRLSEARERAHVGDFTGATAALRAALNIEPQLTSEPDREVASWVAMAQVKKAKRLAASNKWAEAIKLLRQAVALDADNESAYLALASALNNTHEYDKAAEAMRKALKIIPSALNMIDLADSLRLNKEYPEAIALLNRAIAINPRSERARRILGLVFLATHDSEKALNQFTSAIAIAPTTYAYQEMAGIYESRKDFTRALDNLHKAEALDRNYVPVYEDASRIYLEELGDFEAAYRELSVAHALTPDEAGLKADYVEVCLTAGRFQEAIDTANELLQLPVLLQELNASDQLAVRFMKVAALLLSGHPKQASKSRQELNAYFGRLPAFTQTWSYAGTRRFLTDYTMDQDKRFTLLQLLEVLENKTKGVQ